MFSNDSGENLIMILVFGALAIGVGKLIYGWYYEINRRNKYMEIQIYLLSKIAKNNGVSEEEIQKLTGNNFMSHVKMKKKEPETIVSVN